MSAISQMQMAYQAEEDRILFRVNSTQRQEFRFWVTRRFAMLLLKVLGDHRSADPDLGTLANPMDKQAVQSFKKEQAMGGANFETQFEDSATEYPLGEQAVLAYRLNYRVRDDGNLLLGVEPREGQGINLVISQEINITLTELLLAAARKGDWKLDEWRKAQTSAAPGPVIN